MSAEQVVAEALHEHGCHKLPCRGTRHGEGPCASVYTDRAEAAIAALREHGYVVVRAPRVPFPGGSTNADFMRSAAAHIEGGYPVGGSNVTATVLRLLRDVADALDAQ